MARRVAEAQTRCRSQGDTAHDIDEYIKVCASGLALHIAEAQYEASQAMLALSEKMAQLSTVDYAIFIGDAHKKFLRLTSIVPFIAEDGRAAFQKGAELLYKLELKKSLLAAEASADSSRAPSPTQTSSDAQ